jgi:hypothetical protein
MSTTIPPVARRNALRALAFVSLAALASVSMAPAARAQGAAPKNRLVIQVTDNDPARWNMILNNAHNAQEDVGAANIEIEIVAYGPGINMLKKESVVGGRIDEAVKSGVKVVACQNTMKGFKLSKDDMLMTVGYVPAGITEIMKKQQEGWAYVRP